MISVGRVTLPVGESRLVLIETQVGDQCVATFQRTIGTLAGLAFDKAYVGDQLHAHYEFFDRATVYRRHASPALAPVLDEGLPIIQRHIATLASLLAKLEAAR
jgi:hypothetical protein